MDPRFSAQDILLCDLCQTVALQSHCELCHINLCIVCVGKHLSDSSKRHKVVPYKDRTSTPSYPKCPKHTQKHCELYCGKCDIPVCSTCISSGKQKEHDLSDALQKLGFKIKYLENELEDLEKGIHPTFEKITSDLSSEKVNLEKHYEKLTTAVTKQGEDWHREINIIVNKQKSEIDEMKSKHLAALNNQEKEIKQITSDVKQSIHDLKKILDSNDASLTSAYKSRNAEFRRLPPKINLSLPKFSPQQIKTEQLHQMFGSLSGLSITKEEHGYTMKTQEAVSCPPIKPPLDEPKLITTIDTEYNKLHSVTCLSNEEIWTRGDDKAIALYNPPGKLLKSIDSAFSPPVKPLFGDVKLIATINTGYEFLRSVDCITDDEIWTRGDDKFLKLFNLGGKLLNSIKTKSGETPYDIAVTRSRHLVYTDPNTRTVNIVKNKQIQEVIRLKGWKPYNICSTSSGDILVIMNSEDDEQSKVVRYCGLKETQTIQFDSEGKPLFSYNYLKHISENRNLDICVADWEAHEVVVVNKAGKLRFRYPSTTSKSYSFNPGGITTDSKSQILTAEYYKNWIHILNQDGQFLRYIRISGLNRPYGLCVDTRDNLFVAECLGGKVKKIKYM